MQAEHLKGKLLRLIRFRRVPAAELLFLFQNLEVMVRSGIPLVDALHGLETQTSHTYLKEVIGDVRSNLERGNPLSTSLAHYPQIFPEIAARMIAVGETSGTLDRILREIVIHMRTTHALKQKVRAALLYPTVVVTVMVIIGFFVFTYVVPRLTSILVEMNVTLPLPTRILMALGNFFGTYWLLVLIILIFLIVGSHAVLKTTRGRYMFDTAILHIPITNGLSHQLNCALVAQTLGSLLKTDIPITTALEVTAPILGNVQYRTALRAALPGVKSGQALSTIFAQSPHLFPPTFTQMMQVGEKSGTSDEVLNELAQFYQSEAMNLLETLPTLIEPILIVLLGVGVAGIAVAILLPMYALTQQM